MMTNFTRRTFLQNTILGGAFAGLTTRLDLFAKDETLPVQNAYGALSPTASVNTGEFFLSLPPGFQYNVFGKTNSPLTNGLPTPKLPDGMGVFDTGNTWTIIRNHEISDFAGVANTVSGTTPYDSLAGGGTTNLVIDKQTRLPINQYVSLSGTVRNCAGGMTPWGTWISCEETVVGTNSNYGKPHGYCFEISPNSPNNSPVALKQMGRFQHEAVAVDRKLGVVYMTEDNPASGCGFYRFIPTSYGNLSLGGRLQMLAVRNQTNYDTRTNQTVNAPILATWVDIPNPDPAGAETNAAAVFNQGFTNGGATFSRLEGCFSFADKVYFTSTNGGNAGLGQVWEYRHHKGDNGILKLIYESPNANVLDFPDNVCFGNNGDMFICEDGTNGNFIRILGVNGVLSNFAQNIVPSFETFEFTGGIFTRNKQVFFVNLQTPGITCAIWGNW
jgi:uncharacterized protein